MLIPSYLTLMPGQFNVISQEMCRFERAWLCLESGWNLKYIYLKKGQGAQRSLEFSKNRQWSWSIAHGFTECTKMNKKFEDIFNNDLWLWSLACSIWIKNTIGLTNWRVPTISLIRNMIPWKTKWRKFVQLSAKSTDLIYMFRGFAF